MSYVRADISKKDHERMLDAETRASDWLARGNQLTDEAFTSRDEPSRRQLIENKAAICFSKSQFWLDRANKLRGLS